MDSTLVLAHRGFHRTAPENTMEAFEEAVSMGVDGIETDVRLSSDGLPVLFHDRIAPDGTEVDRLTRSELSEIAGYPVPTLDAALEAFDGILWNIEVKTPAAVDTTRRILGGYAASRQLLVTSFWHDLLRDFVGIRNVQCGLLVAHHPLDHASFAALLQDDRIRTIVWDYEILDSTLVSWASENGLRSFVYGAATRREHRRCMRYHVAGVITDDPGLAREDSDDEETERRS